MPGPLLAAAVSNSAEHGAKAGPLLILGHGILETVLVVALFLGLAPILTDEAVFMGIALAGGAILILMAISMLRSLPKISLQAAGTLPGGMVCQKRLVLGGILLSVANPYWTIWWATIGLALLLESREAGWFGVFVFFAGHILADLAWYSFISFTVGRGRRFLSDRTYRILIGFCAIFLCALGIYFVYSAFGRAADHSDMSEMNREGREDEQSWGGSIWPGTSGVIPAGCRWRPGFFQCDGIGVSSVDERQGGDGFARMVAPVSRDFRVGAGRLCPPLAGIGEEKFGGSRSDRLDAFHAWIRHHRLRRRAAGADPVDCCASSPATAGREEWQSG